MPAVPPVRSRLAPTPSGFLHLGNGVAFVLTWLLTRQQGGRLRLRIDDADDARRRDGYVEDIFAGLAWLGLDWDDGPTGSEDFYRHHSQSHRRAAYAAALRRLASVPNAVYACDLSRRQLRALLPGRPSPSRDALLDLDAPDVAWRARVDPSDVVRFREGAETAAVDLAAAMGDFVVRRRDGTAAYQLTSLVDDVAYGTN
ncbi:MAG: glutamate--tRNA ligase family protein, partial [Catalinimonas sp.]